MQIVNSSRNSDYQVFVRELRMKKLAILVQIIALAAVRLEQYFEGFYTRVSEDRVSFKEVITIMGLGAVLCLVLGALGLRP